MGQRSTADISVTHISWAVHILCSILMNLWYSLRVSVSALVLVATSDSYVPSNCLLEFLQHWMVSHYDQTPRSQEEDFLPKRCSTIKNNRDNLRFHWRASDGPNILKWYPYTMEVV
jgi:hypothetical protein